MKSQMKFKVKAKLETGISVLKISTRSGQAFRCEFRSEFSVDFFCVVYLKEKIHQESASEFTPEFTGKFISVFTLIFFTFFFSLEARALVWCRFSQMQPKSIKNSLC